MANWAYVEHKEIMELHDVLPRNWRHVSGLYLGAEDLGALASLGWLPVRRPDTEDDHVGYRVDSWRHELDHDVVWEIPVLVACEPEIEPEITAQITVPLLAVMRCVMGDLAELLPRHGVDLRAGWSGDLEHLRQVRDQLLQRSDYTQFADVQATMTQQQQMQWRQYRSALRELPQRAQDLDPGSLACC